MRNLILLFLFASLQLQAQHEDQSWIAGYSGSQKPEDEVEFFVFSMKFNEDSTKSYHRFKYCKTIINGASSSICDKYGRMIIFFNGEEIYHSNMQPMKGSDSLNYFPKGWEEYQIFYPQNGLVLPYPNHNNQYMLIYQERGPFQYKIDSILEEVSGAIKTQYCIIDMDKQGGFGEVIKRKQLINSDTLLKGRLSAVRHANGRDWWIISQKFASNIYYKFLLTPKGITLFDKQTIGLDDFGSLGQTVFSPDGKYFIDFDIEGKVVQSIVFEFDRCSGKLANPQYLNFPDWKPCGGAAVSPNSRYLYINRYDTLYQFDLKAMDLWKSKQVVGVFDGYFVLNALSTGMYNMKLAADGKIYIVTQGSTPFMHVIHNPDMPGLFCNFELRGLKLPAFHAWGIPNYPNFALGALKGSPCDTLGNVAVQEVKQKDGFKVYPNPANDILTIETLHPLPYEIVIKDVTGRIFYQNKATFNTQISVSELMNGLYFCEFWQNNKRIAQQKIIIIH